MNISLSSYKKTALLLLTAGLATVKSYSQNTPVMTETAPAGSANTFSVPPALPYPNNTTGDYNYSRTITPIVPFTNTQDVTVGSAATDVRISTTFKDGFNRPMQTIVHNFTNNAKPHLAIPSDTRFQRDGYSYLPYAVVNDPSINADPQAQYHSTPFQLQQTYYSVLFPGEGYTSFGRETYSSDANQRSTISYAPGKSQVGQNRAAPATVRERLKPSGRY